MPRARLRIVAGRFGGRHLAGASGIRPTGERVRAAVFDRLGVEVQGARVLELFAGSGALGLEALSRGARSAVLVERDRRAAEAIQANLADLGATAEEARCLRCDVVRAVGVLARRGEVFDLVLADPPYRESAGLRPDSPLGRAVTGLAEAGCLAEGALVVVEHRREPGLTVDWPDFEVEAVRTYGDSQVTYLRYRAGPGAAAEKEP